MQEEDGSIQKICDIGAGPGCSGGGKWAGQHMPHDPRWVDSLQAIRGWAEPTPAFARLLCGHFQGRLAMSLLLQELRALALPGNRPEHGHAAPGQVQYRHLNPLLKPCMNE